MYGHCHSDTQNLTMIMMAVCQITEAQEIDISRPTVCGVHET